VCNVREELCQITSDDATFLSMVIDGDKSWICSYDPETKQQFSQWNMKSKAKSILVIFYDIEGIVHKEFVLEGQTINTAYSCDILQQLRENVRRLHPEIWRQKNWQFHHNKAPSHTSFFIRGFLTKNNMTVIPHPPYFSIENKTEMPSF
jgi:hypothetical protein